MKGATEKWCEMQRSSNCAHACNRRYHPEKPTKVNRDTAAHSGTHKRSPIAVRCLKQHEESRQPIVRFSRHTSQSDGRYLYHSKRWRTLEKEPPDLLDKIKSIAKKLGQSFRVPDASYTSEDLVSEAWLKCFLGLPEILEAENPEDYAWKVVRNHLRNLFKRASKFGQTPFSRLNQGDTDDDRSAEEIAEARDLYQRSARDERAQRVADTVKVAVDKLPKREGQIIRAYFWNELNFKQIAEILGIKETRVRELYVLAIKKLRVLLHPLSDISRFDLGPLKSWTKKEQGESVWK